MSGLWLPTIFLDRCLGADQVPEILRDAGLDVIVHDHHYGKIAGESIHDTDWLELVAENDWIAFTKDKRIRVNPAEKRTILKYKVRCFCIAGSAGIKARQAADRFLENLDEIAEACHAPGPFVYSLRRDHIQWVFP